MLELILFSLSIIFVYLLFFYWRYNKSSYKHFSDKNFLIIRFSVGLFGEFLTYRKLEKKYSDMKLLPNVYINKKDGETTEIDLIGIHKTGIYVFESKNYGGWIFGDGKRKNWMQTFKTGQKNSFYNPVWQNHGHIKALEDYLNLDEEYFKSIIVFSKRCKIKKLNNIDKGVVVLRRPLLIIKTKKFIRKNETILSDKEINKIYEKLIKGVNVNENIKEKHINDIKNKINRS